MNPKPILLLTAVILALTLATPALANAPFFMGLGDFAGGDYYSRATAISGDGSTVVGTSRSADGWQSFRWTQAEGLVAIGPSVPYDPANDDSIWAAATSYDGSVIVGGSHWRTQTNGDRFAAWKWSSGGGYETLNYAAAGPQWWAYATDVSADGSVITGTVDTSTQTQAWAPRPGRWSASADPTILSGNWLDSRYAVAHASSADGSVVVGEDSDRGVFRWSETGGIERLATPGYDSTDAAALAVSADGTIAVGGVHAFEMGEWNNYALRWDASGAMTVLPPTADGLPVEGATAISPDGSLVFGYAYDDSGPFIDPAVVWDEANSTRVLEDVLVNDYGLDLGGWRLGRVRAVADDNLTIIGGGINPNGELEAFIARLPEPGTLISLALITLLAVRRRG